MNTNPSPRNEPSYDKNKIVIRNGLGGVRTMTIDPPAYLHNQQQSGVMQKPVVEPIQKTFEVVDETAEAPKPKPKRKRKTKADAALDKAVEKDLSSRNLKPIEPNETDDSD